MLYRTDYPVRLPASSQNDNSFRYPSVSGSSSDAIIDFGIDGLKDYVKETPEARREANHNINRMNAEKITASEASMIRLRDIMMSIMLEQAKEIRNDRPITTEDMSNIIVDYLAQSGLDEKAQKIVKKLCLHLFKGKE